MMVVDHPTDVAVFVDERFAREAPALAVHAMRQPQPIARAWDQDGKDVTELRRQRGTAAIWARSHAVAYQGVAADHFVEVEIGRTDRPRRRLWLVASGFVYPTDSSINVAIGQGGRIQPRGVSLEARDARWPLGRRRAGSRISRRQEQDDPDRSCGRSCSAGLGGARRLRLRTNLEIYWDSIGYAVAVSDASFRTLRLAPVARRPAVPRILANAVRSPRRAGNADLQISSPTRSRAGAISSATTRGSAMSVNCSPKVEDRYVIMNAGDELRLSFTAPPPPAAGWTRDFVLIGDGWVKDGDFNTSYSKTVLPLPSTAARSTSARSPALGTRSRSAFTSGTARTGKRSIHDSSRRDAFLCAGWQATDTAEDAHERESVRATRALDAVDGDVRRLARRRRRAQSVERGGARR